jgi:hypothetical protein
MRYSKLPSREDFYSRADARVILVTRPRPAMTAFLLELLQTRLRPAELRPVLVAVFDDDRHVAIAKPVVK